MDVENGRKNPDRIPRTDQREHVTATIGVIREGNNVKTTGCEILAWKSLTVLHSGVV
jgi:hypothetical protein